ncbi:M48 family metalloprotease [Candidatus Parvarchaeota archaeon]|nr:M48 family metalloprotease [Candidatus Parvarchaeota archaeon]
MSTPKIVLLFSVLSLMMIAIGSVLGLFLGSIILWMSVFFLIAIAINVVSYYKSDSIAIKMTRTNIINRKDDPRFYSIVEKVTGMAGIPMPKVGIMPSDVGNAFATGRDEKHAVVVATSGILKMLDDAELEAVIGHEVSHITHRDILVTSIAATIATVISYIGNIILFSEIFGGLNERNSNMSFILLISAILIPLGATFVQLGISRARETDADIGSVKLVKRPNELISALKTISKPQKQQPVMRSLPNRRNSPQPGAYSSLFIVNNFSGHALLNLFSTHPTLEKRIETINRTKKELGL